MFRPSLRSLITSVSTLILLLLCSIALLGLAARDIAAGQLSGASIPLEQIMFGSIIFLILLASNGLVVSGRFLTGLGLSVFGNAYLLRQAFGTLWGDNLTDKGIIIIVTCSYVVIELIGLAVIMTGWRQGERWLNWKLPPSSVPPWLQPIAAETRHPKKHGGVTIITMASNVLNAYLIGRNIWPDSIWLLIATMSLLSILGIVGLVSIVRHDRIPFNQGGNRK